VIDGSLGGIF